MREIQKIAEFVVLTTQVSIDLLKSKSKADYLVQARDIFIFIAIQNGISYSEIARFLMRDHTSIIHSYKKEKKGTTDGYFMEIFNKYLEYRSKEDPETKAIIKLRMQGKYGYVYERFNGKCCVCGFSEIVEVHHIKPRRMGGDDSPDNLILLCPNHHSMSDQGMIHIEGIPIVIHKA